MMQDILRSFSAVLMGMMLSIPLVHSTGNTSIELVSSSGLNFLVEGCTENDSIRISLDTATLDTARFTIQLAGDATLNEDYQINFPAEIVFPPGNTSQSFPITTLTDGLEEGEETIAINLLDENNQTVASISISLLDEIPVLINEGVKDTLYVCQDLDVELNGSGAESYQWRPASLFDNPEMQDQSISVFEDTWIYLDGMLGNCTATDSVFLRAVDPALEITAEGSTMICTGNSVQLGLDANFPVNTVTWSPEEGLDDPTSPDPISSPNNSIVYNVTAFLDNCVATDNIQIDVDSFNFPEITTEDTVICQGSPLQLATIDQVPSGMTFEWSPGTGLSDSTAPDPVLIPEETSIYQLIATSENGNCADTAEVSVEVLPADIEINNEDTVYLCKGDSVNLTTTSSGNGVSLNWSPAEGLSSTTEPNVTADPEVSTLYTITFEADNGCIVRDSVWVRVDSLPDFEIENVPKPDPMCNKYCVGDVFTLTTEPTPDNKYPDAEFMWRPMDGSIQDSLTFLNAAVKASTTQYYIRETVNNACREVDSIYIEVIDPTIPISLEDTTVCENQPVDVTIDTEDLTNIQWMPEDQAPCMSCPNPTFQVSQTTTFTVTATKELCCPASASVTINIPPPIPIPNDTVITCPGEPVQIDMDPPGDLENITWNPSQQLSCSDCEDPTATVPNTMSFTITGFIDECRARGQAVVQTYDVPDVELVPDTTGAIPQGAPVVIEADLIPPQNNPGFTWFEEGNMTGQTGSMAEFIVKKEGAENLYSVTVVDDNGCEITQEILITGVKPEVEMPDAFSPNNDDLNDFFRPVIKGAEFIPDLIGEFRIYNRWGNVVYEGGNPQQGWNGRWNGEPAPPDVYIYYVELNYPDGSSETLEGDVTLIR